MAGLNVIEPNLMKNVFSRLIKTQQILTNRFMRESIVAVSKLNTKYAVMLIYASCCLSAVEANDNNQTNRTSSTMESTSSDKTTLEGAKLVGAIVGSIVGVLTLVLSALTLYYTMWKDRSSGNDPEENTENENQGNPEREPLNSSVVHNTVSNIAENAKVTQQHGDRATFNNGGDRAVFNNGGENTVNHNYDQSNNQLNSE